MKNSKELNYLATSPKAFRIQTVGQSRETKKKSTKKKSNPKMGKILEEGFKGF